MKHIFAFTLPGASYPAYISVNSDVPQHVSFTVRNQGAPNGSLMILSNDQARQLAYALLQHVGGNREAAL